MRHGIPVVVLVGNDSVWGTDYHQQFRFFGRPVATELSQGTRYDLVAWALGAPGEYVLEASDLVPALKRACDASGPAVVNICTRWILETKRD